MSDPAIDLEVFSELRSETGPEFAAELVTTFLDEAPGMIADLKSAAQAGDADGFRRAAHSLKSNASVFGASQLAALSRDFEMMDIDTGTSGFRALDAEFARVDAALRSLLND